MSVRDDFVNFMKSSDGQTLDDAQRMSLLILYVATACDELAGIRAALEERKDDGK